MAHTELRVGVYLRTTRVSARRYNLSRCKPAARQNVHHLQPEPSAGSRNQHRAALFKIHNTAHRGLFTPSLLLVCRRHTASPAEGALPPLGLVFLLRLRSVLTIFILFKLHYCLPLVLVVPYSHIQSLSCN